MKNVLKGLVVMGMATGMLFGQAAPAAAPSADEIKDLQAIQSKQIASPADADARMAAVNQFVAKYPASSLRGYVLTLAGEAAQGKQDSAKARFYYEQAIAADPNSDYAMIMLGADIAQNTKENAIDKAQQMARATKLANDAMALIEKRVKNPQESQADFDAANKSDMSRAHMTLGLVAMQEQKFEAAGDEFVLASESDPVNLLRAGMAYNNAKKVDAAEGALNKFIAIPGLPDQYKKMAEDEKKRGQLIKNGK